MHTRPPVPGREKGKKKTQQALFGLEKQTAVMETFGFPNPGDVGLELL